MCRVSWSETECDRDVVRQVEAVRRIKGDECHYEVDRIAEECVSYQHFHVNGQFPCELSLASSPQFSSFTCS